MEPKKITLLYKFEQRNGKHVFYSRHEFPDFCAGMTREERDKKFKVTKVTDQKEIEENTW